MNFWKENQGCLVNVTDINEPQFVLGFEELGMLYLDNYQESGGVSCESLTPGV